MKRGWFALCGVVLLLSAADAAAAPWQGQRIAIPPAQDENSIEPEIQPVAASPGDQAAPSPAVSFIRGDALDPWCKGARSPLLTATCGDDDLRALALRRLSAFEEAKSRLVPDRQKELVADQNGWAMSYPQACGLQANAQPALPLAPSLKDCLLKGGQSRLQYLQSYGQQSAQNSAGSTANPAPAITTPSTAAAPSNTQSPTPAPPDNPAPAPPESKAPAAPASTSAPATSAPAAAPAKPAAGDRELAPKPRDNPSLVKIGDFTRTGAMLIVVIVLAIWLVAAWRRSRRMARTAETPEQRQ